MLAEVQLFRIACATEATAIHALVLSQPDDRIDTILGHVHSEILLPVESLAIRAAAVGLALSSGDSIVSFMNTSNIA